MVNSYEIQTDLNNTKLFTKLGANPLNQNIAPKSRQPTFVDQVFHGCRYTPVHRASHGGRDWNEGCHRQGNTMGVVHKSERNTIGVVHESQGNTMGVVQESQGRCKSGSWENCAGKIKNYLIVRTQTQPQHNLNFIWV